MVFDKIFSKEGYNMKRILVGLFTFALLVPKAFADNVWVNDLRSLFLSNNAIPSNIQISLFIRAPCFLRLLRKKRKNRAPSTTCYSHQSLGHAEFCNPEDCHTR